MEQRRLADCAIVLNGRDNVATALVDMPAGRYALGAGGGPIDVPQDVRAGFKLAVRPIGLGERVVKYGYVIGLATEEIHPGQCVHVHNLASSV